MPNIRAIRIKFTFEDDFIVLCNHERVRMKLCALGKLAEKGKHPLSGYADRFGCRSFEGVEDGRTGRPFRF